MKPSLRLVVAVAVVLLVGLSASAAALAQEDPRPSASGVDISARTGFAIPFGKADGDAVKSLGDEINGAIPIALEVAYRINPQISLGAMFQYGLLLFKNTTDNMCGGGVSCSGSDVRLLVELLYHVPMPGTFSPWLGVGAGYEWLSLTASMGAVTQSVGASGFEFLALQAGGDFQVAAQFALGPFVMFSLGQFGSESASGSYGNASADVTNTTTHEWLEFGVRGTVGL